MSFLCLLIHQIFRYLIIRFQRLRCCRYGNMNHISITKSLQRERLFSGCVQTLNSRSDISQICYNDNVNFSVDLFIFLFIHQLLSIHLFVYLCFICLFHYLFLFIHLLLFINSFVYFLICLWFICLSLCLFIHLCFHLFLYLLFFPSLIYLFTYSFLDLYISLSVYFFAYSFIYSFISYLFLSIERVTKSSNVPWNEY